MERTIKSEWIYKGKVINLKVDEVELPDGNKSRREIVVHRGAAAIVPVDEEGNIFMVRQYRKPVEKELLEIPAGTLEEGEDPLECAKRELVEETGFAGKRFHLLASFYSTPGFTTEKLYVYLAEGLYREKGEMDFDEFIEVEKIPLENLFSMVMEGKIEDAKSIIGILLTYQKLKG